MQITKVTRWNQGWNGGIWLYFWSLITGTLISYIFLDQIISKPA
jgi:hypothetical protein